MPCTGDWLPLRLQKFDIVCAEIFVESSQHCEAAVLPPALQLIERANEWAKLLRISDFVDFRVANATVAFDHLLSTYPGPLELVAIQWCVVWLRVLIMAVCVMAEEQMLPLHPTALQQQTSRNHTRF